ncbi:hypothetical protein H1R20_g14392, partial [Candolleomyces eurysporus]
MVLKMRARFIWSSTGPLISPKNDSRNLAGVKDPSIVYHDGVWHVFATTAKSGSWGLFYTNFTTWSQAASAPFFYLDQSGIGTGYRAAPQIFYFAPQKLWYLVYQNGNAAYSTNPDIDNPAGWTEPKTFYSGMPKIVEQHIGEGYWLDMWVICDEALCHLFSSDDNGQLYRSETPLENFPDGFNEPVIALQDPNRFRLFEASNVYQYAKDSYLLLVEAIGTDERRWFRSWTSSSIAGPWKELAAEEDNAFMRSNNVVFPSGTPEWTKDFSHGEMIRSGVDQEMKINPCKMVYFYQGMDPNAEGPYGDLPWRLALVTQTNSAC